ncbi:MAG: preprotein translocase subunit SecA [Legionella sp. 40-6]|nr:YchJ family protein [Legionella sp.]OJY01914.1 MAG: preprotein translocase subunit SecA [Legionella sp. 40-6]
MPLCPCGSLNAYQECCKRFIDSAMLPETPEQLMRSRYTAYTQGKIDYIQHTMKDKALIDFNPDEAKEWALSVHWMSLKIIDAPSAPESVGYVEFKASYRHQDTINYIHERSEFHKIDKQWYYVDGIMNPPRHKAPRNSPCPCGSGKKFKNCHDKFQ